MRIGTIAAVAFVMASVAASTCRGDTEFDRRLAAYARWAEGARAQADRPRSPRGPIPVRLYSPPPPVRWSEIIKEGRPAAEEAAEAKADTKQELSEVAKASDDPVSQLWQLALQNEFTIFEDDRGDRRLFSSMKFQPIVPLRLTGRWRVINRPVFEFASEVHRDRPGDPWERESCLGDTILATLFTTTKPRDKVVWGVGPTWIFPTAAEDTLGDGKVCLGPGATFFYLGKKWVFGSLFQNWFSFAGDGGRPPVSATDFQYFIRYRPTPTTGVGMTPTIKIDWTEGDGYSVPIGLGGDVTIRLGKLPVRIGAEAQYYLTQPKQFGRVWNFKVFFIPTIPAPSFAEKPLLGK